jgi:hypothetical protein
MFLTTVGWNAQPMTCPHAQPAVDLAATTAEAVRQLNHLTIVPRALAEPAELDRIVAELATMACRLPQDPGRQGP